MSIMNYNRILRASNFLFVCCGYQVQWFSVTTRQCTPNVYSVIYLICFAVLYAVCFGVHFLESSSLNFLVPMAPRLHKMIRVHLFLGLKVWLFVGFEMKYIAKALNDLINVLPAQTNFNWTRKDIKAGIWLFSGLIINFIYALYIVYEMEFRIPTFNQILHGFAMFLPHFALACSFKVLNLISLLSRSELQSIHSKFNDAMNNGSSTKNVIELATTAPSQPIDVEIRIPNLEALQLLVKQLKQLTHATRIIHQAVQKQMLFLFVMNGLSLLAASYSIVYFKKAWHLILEESVGNGYYVFCIGVFIFIFWDYFCLCVVNCLLENAKFKLLNDITEAMRSKFPVEDEKKVALKDMKYLLKHNFDMRIFFRMPITWQTFFIVNTMVGFAIAIFVSFHYLDDNIDDLETQVNADED